MGEFRKNLQEKINSRKEKALSPQEKLLKESRNLENALIFLEMTSSEAKEGWHINSYKELTGRGLKGKLNIFRKKLQRKSLHWYLEPICDDQSAYNQKVQQALTAMEDFAKAQAAWNRAFEERYETEQKAFRAEITALRKELARLKEKENEE